MFHAFRLTLSAAGECAENLENRSWGKNIEEKAKSPHAERSCEETSIERRIGY